MVSSLMYSHEHIKQGKMSILLVNNNIHLCLFIVIENKSMKTVFETSPFVFCGRKVMWV